MQEIIYLPDFTLSFIIILENYGQRLSIENNIPKMVMNKADGHNAEETDDRLLLLLKR